MTVGFWVLLLLVVNSLCVFADEIKPNQLGVRTKLTEQVGNVSGQLQAEKLAQELVVVKRKLARLMQESEEGRQRPLFLRQEASVFERGWRYLITGCSYLCLAVGTVSAVIFLKNRWKTWHHGKDSAEQGFVFKPCSSNGSEQPGFKPFFGKGRTTRKG